MTNELRKTIRTKLLTLDSALGVKDVYYKVASDKALYPHIVFSFDGINSLSNDNNRKDYRLVIDVWDKGTSASACENITDAVISLFNALNLPQTNILPTFYFESSISVLDEDKTIQHNQIKYSIQNYERN